MSIRHALILVTLGLLAGCSSSFGGGGSSPRKIYVVMPNGQVVPAQTTARPPGG